MSQQIMITITDTLVKLIIMILKAKKKIREVEYFDLELECLHRIMGKTRFSPARLSEIDVVAAVSSDSTAQVLRNSRSEFRLLPLA